MLKNKTTTKTTVFTKRQRPVRNLGTYSNVINDRSLYDILFSSSEMNFVDKAAYPDVAVMEQQTVAFLLELTNGTQDGVGFATTGSSEAIVLALAWHRNNFMSEHPEKAHSKLNFIINEGYHKAFDKFATLVGTELKAAPLNEDLTIDIEAAEKLIDENTFCLVGIAGSTEIGMVDEITELNKLALLHKLPLHVDAAIGGYVLPFMDGVSDWNFALPAVQSINISAHKYGLCLPGIGFLLVRDQSIIPKNYHTEIDYLAGGGVEDNALSCSRNASFVINAHHNMTQYGFEGYKTITKQNFAHAQYLADQLKKLPIIDHIILGDVPIALFSSPQIKDLSAFLSEVGWIQSAHYIRALERRYIRIVLRQHLDTAILNDFLTSIGEFQTSNTTPKQALAT